MGMRRGRAAGRGSKVLGAAVLFTSWLVAGSASAQQPGEQPLPAPPPGFAPPPPGYGQPPPAGYGQPPPAPGYAPQPGYAQPVYGQPLYYTPPGYNAGPKTLDYDEGAPVPAGYHPETRVRKGLVITGGVLFGTFYVFSVFGAAAASDSGDKNVWPLFIPAIGPFIAAGTESGHSSVDGSVAFLYVLDGLVQTGGLAMFILGMTFPSNKLVRDDVASSRSTFSIAPAPVALGNGRYGLGFAGTL